MSSVQKCSFCHYITSCEELYYCNETVIVCKPRSVTAQLIFPGLYVSGEHVAFSHKATMLTRVGACATAVDDLWRRVIPIEEMSDLEKAGVSYLRAGTLYLCGTEGKVRAVESMREAVLLDSDNLEYALRLIEYKKHLLSTVYGGQTKQSDVEDILAVADSVLSLELEPWMRVKFEHVKFMSIGDYLYNHAKGSYSRHELHRERRKLADSICKNASPNESGILADCALYYSVTENHRAVEIIEEVLENHPLNSYVNTKASTIFYRVNDLNKALRCAEIAAESSVATYMRMLWLKTILEHTFDVEQFLLAGLVKFREATQIRTIHKSAFIYYTLTGKFKKAIEHFKQFLDSSPPEEYFMSRELQWIHKEIRRFHTGEAAYNVILRMVGGDDPNSDGGLDEDDLELFMEVKREIENSMDVTCFKSLERSPEEYLESLRLMMDLKSEHQTGPGVNSVTTYGIRNQQMPPCGGRCTSSRCSNCKNSTRNAAGESRDWRSKSFEGSSVHSSDTFPTSRSALGRADWRSRGGNSGSRAVNEQSSSQGWRSRQFGGGSNSHQSHLTYRSSSVHEDWRSRDPKSESSIRFGTNHKRH